MSTRLVSSGGESELTTFSEWGCSSMMLLSGMRVASALFIAGRNGRTTRKRSFEEGAVPRQRGACKIASTPCFAPVISLFLHSGTVFPVSLT